MPPKAPSGAVHMIRRMTPKTIWDAISNAPRTRERSGGDSADVAAATYAPQAAQRVISRIYGVAPSARSGYGRQEATEGTGQMLKDQLKNVPFFGSLSNRELTGVP